MTALRQAVEDSMNDIRLGTEERLRRAEQRIAAAILGNIDAVKLSEESLSEGFDSWADGFRQGWQAAREAVTR